MANTIKLYKPLSELSVYLSDTQRFTPPQPVRKRHFFNVSQRIEPLSRPNLSPSEGIFFFIIIFD